MQNIQMPLCLHAACVALVFAPVMMHGKSVTASPGCVLTPGLRPTNCAQISAQQSVSDQLAYLATASQGRDNGRFVDHQGNTMDW